MYVAPAKSLSHAFNNNRVFFALKLLIASVLRPVSLFPLFQPRSARPGIHENGYRTLAGIS